MNLVFDRVVAVEGCGSLAEALPRSGRLTHLEVTT